MGSLSPRTRNAQVALYQSGEVDFLVATDAIGMGLNMDVDHVAFAGLRKFDGKRTRWLHAAGDRPDRRPRRALSCATAPSASPASAEELDEDLVEAGREPPLRAGRRPPNGATPRLDFDTLPDLLRSLAAPPDARGPEAAGRGAGRDHRCARWPRTRTSPTAPRPRGALMRLWEVCQTPDFRKTTPRRAPAAGRARSSTALTSRRGRLPEDWIARAVRRTSTAPTARSTRCRRRLASVRTLAYVANRPDWLAIRPAGRAGPARSRTGCPTPCTRRLMARFVDRRTSALMRGAAACARRCWPASPPTAR